ncbi:MAG: hypothetical protein Kow0090_04940 [Myxococcota bacterium]
MISNIIRNMILGGALVSLFALTATAQSEEETAGGESLAIDPQIASMSAAQKMESGRIKIDEMRADLKRVLDILEKAREEKDIIRLDCVNKKLTAIKGLLRIAEQANIQLQESAAKKDDTVATHEYQKILIAHQKVKALRAEAEACTGAEDVFIGEGTTVEVEQDVEAAGEDMTGVRPDSIATGGATTAPNKPGETPGSEPSGDSTDVPANPAEANNPQPISPTT